MMHLNSQKWQCLRILLQKNQRHAMFYRDYTDQTNFIFEETSRWLLNIKLCHYFRKNEHLWQNTWTMSIQSIGSYFCIIWICNIYIYKYIHMHIDIDMYIKYVLMFCSSHKWLFKKERKKEKRLYALFIPFNTTQSIQHNYSSQWYV